MSGPKPSCPFNLFYISLHIEIIKVFERDLRELELVDYNVITSAAESTGR